MTENMNLINIPIINPGRNYWLVRSNGGKYYPSYILNDYVAIGWDKIDRDLLSNRKIITPQDIERFYKPKDENKRVNYSLTAGQINRFVSEMKKGDIVITPSEDSKYISFGEVMDNEIYFVEESIIDKGQKLKKSDEHYCPHIKRRKVQWLTRVEKNQLDPLLYKMFFTHLTVSEIKKEYIPFIDRTIDSLFIKDDLAHIVLKVNQKGKIQADLLAEFLSSTLRILDNDYQYIKNADRKNIDIKLNVQSPGPIEFIGPIQDVLILSSFIFTMFTGYATQFKTNKEQKLKNPSVDEVLEAVNREGMDKYEGRIESQMGNLAGIFEDLKIENPSENINSIKDDIQKGKSKRVNKKKRINNKRK